MKIFVLSPLLLTVRATLFIFLLVPATSWAQGLLPPTAEEDPKQAELLNEGARVLYARKPKQALAYFETVLASYEQQYGNTKARIFCARTLTEAMVYLLEARNQNIDAKVISATWANAYYLKAYSLVELGQVPDAQEALVRARVLSPRNSQYLSELGHIYQLRKIWLMAVEMFEAAEAAAREFSPPQMKDKELARAWKGLGYVFVEQNRLDDAERMYRQCLELNKDDPLCAREVAYVQALKAKPKAPVPIQ
jgi:Flp pilus assembly protein TadD